MPPQANARLAQQQNKYPDRFLSTAEDFNQANLRTVLPKFHQYVNFPLRGENKLDNVYSHILDAYKATPHSGQLYHISAPHSIL